MDIKVYIGGPIDFAVEDPDHRHQELCKALDKAPGVQHGEFCPFCDQRNDPMTPADRLDENHRYLLHADWAVFVWNPATQPSIGTPIEMHSRMVPRGEICPECGTQFRQHSILVTPTEPQSLFIDYFKETGLVVVPDIEAAVAVMVAEHSDVPEFTH